MKVNKVHAAVVAALTGASGLTYQTAFAQEGGLEEIVVTATRREQNLQEVPISIVAITGENLEMRGLDTLEDVEPSRSEPHHHGRRRSTGARASACAASRMSAPTSTAFGKSARPASLTQEFVDLDRIEVLRGPQGTMFGRDSIGGAIRIWTKRPTEEFGGTFNGTLGSLDRRDVMGSLDLPLGDNVKSKFTSPTRTATAISRASTTGAYGGGIDQSS